MLFCSAFPARNPQRQAISEAVHHVALTPAAPCLFSAWGSPAAGPSPELTRPRVALLPALSPQGLVLAPLAATPCGTWWVLSQRELNATYSLASSSGVCSAEGPVLGPL